MTWRSNYECILFSGCGYEIKQYMFHTYCTSHFGSPLWSLEGGQIARFYVNWRKCIRKIWSIPSKTHCRFLQHLHGKSNIDTQLLCRFLQFYKSVLLSENKCVQICGEIVRQSHTNVAINRRIMMFRLSMNEDTHVTHITRENVIDQMKCGSQECIAIAGVIRELCVHKQDLDILTVQETEGFINYLCIH